MGRKRKRGQSKHDWTIPTSRKQKKEQKLRGKGFNRTANVEKGAHVINSIMENISREASILPCEIHQQVLTPPCNIPADKGSKTLRFSGVRNIFARLNSLTSTFQRSTLKRFSSIRNVFLLLDWLRQSFGCGLQTLGKILFSKKNVTITDRAKNSEAIMRRITDLEEEVTFLKSELAKMMTTSCPCGSNAIVCTTTKEGYMVPSPSTVIAPPPPPPPPPPVLPPPAPPLAFLKSKQSGSKRVNSSEAKKKPTTALVTLEDLKKVKLRKVSPEEDRSRNKENIESNAESDVISFKMQPKKMTPRKISQRKDLPQCIISLREIKKVTLKKRKTESEIDKIKLRTPDEMIIMRSNLRKVNITRSPGGTPLVSNRNKENGSGLTPMMTKALQRKFQQAHPYCSPESPTARRRKSFSPMADYSPNTPSPLLINKF